MRRITRIATVATALLATLVGGAHANVSPAKFPTITPLTDRDCQLMKQRNTLQDDSPVVCGRLRAVAFSYNSDAGIKKDGKLVVLDVIAPEVAALMQNLLRQGFYIKQSVPIEAYGGDDIKSMNDNNTSAFNSRRIATGDKNWSLHAYGVVIDLNPLQNPAIYPDQREDDQGNIVAGKPGTALIRPAASSNGNQNYLNRNIYRARPDDDGFYRPGMAEPVVSLFANHGFLTWGGYWNDPLDYQHFEVGPRALIERLYAADPVDSTNPINGIRLFDQYVSTFKACMGTNAELASDANQLRAYCARETIHSFKK